MYVKISTSASVYVFVLRVCVSTYNMQHTMEHNSSTGTNFIQYCCIFSALTIRMYALFFVYLKGYFIKNVTLVRDCCLY